MVNEVAMVLLWGLFGIRIALIYVATGVAVAIVAGIIIGHLHLESWVEDYVYKIKVGQAADGERQTWPDRHDYALRYTADILKKV